MGGQLRLRSIDRPRIVRASGGRLAVGRGPDGVELSINDPAISRAHAWFSRGASGRWELQDCGSAKGTFVDERKVQGRVVVSNGQRVRFASHIFEIAIDPDAHAAAFEPGVFSGQTSLDSQLLTEFMLPSRVDQLAAIYSRSSAEIEMALRRALADVFGGRDADARNFLDSFIAGGPLAGMEESLRRQVLNGPPSFTSRNTAHALDEPSLADTDAAGSTMKLVCGVIAAYIVIAAAMNIRGHGDSVLPGLLLWASLGVVGVRKLRREREIARSREKLLSERLRRESDLAQKLGARARAALEGWAKLASTQKCTEHRESEKVRLERERAASSLESLLVMPWQRFEDAVVAIYRSLGYEIRGTQYSNDGGFDAEVLCKGEKWLVQCKRYSRSKSVGRPAIQQLRGAMAGVGARRGIFVTTSRFTKPAAEYAALQSIELVDGERLVELGVRVFGKMADEYTERCLCGKFLRFRVRESGVKTCSCGWGLRARIGD